MTKRTLTSAMLAVCVGLISCVGIGCQHTRVVGNQCSPEADNACAPGTCKFRASTGKRCNNPDCNECNECEDDGFCKSRALFASHCRNHAIPDKLPLGSIVRAHAHTMQTNAEASDFVIYQSEFVGNTAALTPYGKDHLLEIAARLRQVPFPVVVERGGNNADVELDALRRNLIAKILLDFGHHDAATRVIVAPAYAYAKNSREAEIDYYRFIYTRGFNGIGNFGAGSGFGVGFGGGGGFGF